MNRLRMLRLSNGWSLAELAKKTQNNISKTTLSDYETGKTNITAKDLLVLARALQILPYLILKPANYTITILDFYKDSNSNKNNQEETEAQLIRTLEECQIVLEEIATFEIQPEIKQWPTYPVKERADVEQAAIALREHWQLGQEPIHNLTDMLERHGVRVVALSEVPKGFQGLSAKIEHHQTEQHQTEHLSYGLAYVAGSTGERQRSTLAHQLGHVVLDISPDLNEEDIVQSFAAAFLMPKEQMHKMFGQHVKQLNVPILRILKQFFGASMQTIVYRAKELGIIDAKQYSSFFKYMNKQGWPTVEPYPLPEETSVYWQLLKDREADLPYLPTIYQEESRYWKMAELLENVDREWIVSWLHDKYDEDDDDNDDEYDDEISDIFAAVCEDENVFFQQPKNLTLKVQED